MAPRTVPADSASASNPRNGTPRSRAQDHGIDAVIAIDATIAALQAQRVNVIATNRAISYGGAA